MQEKISQRERNFRDTWNAIHEAAFTLAVTEQSAQATVEGIAESAGISRRTFFNYFSSKEDAILGVRAPKLTEEIVDAYASSEEDEFTRVVTLQLGVMRTALPPSGLQRRRQAVKELPSLSTRLSGLLSDVEKLVREVLLNQSESIALPADREAYVEGEELEVLLSLASSVLRHALVMHYHQKVELDPLIAHSVGMFRKVVDQTR